MSKFSSSSILIAVIHNNKKLILDAEKQIYSNILYKYLYTPIYSHILVVLPWIYMGTS